MLVDYHVHTEFSDDSEYPMEDVARRAIDLGLTEICFTDHVDYGIKRDWDDPRGILYRPGGVGEPERMPATNVDYPKYVSELRRLQDKYRGKLTIRLGLEFGVQIHTIPKYEKLYARYPFDFILLSVHQVEDMEFWNQKFQTGRSQEENNLRYYEEMLALVRKFHNYSTLAHLDLVSRYDKNGPYPFEKIRPIVTEILKTVIADGKGIEVNTSYQRYGLSDMTPSRDILRLYRDLGGTILTLGSDSHKEAHLGAYLAETKEELKKLGFRQFCTYQQMRPVFHDL